jgi:hypothetical protein
MDQTLVFNNLKTIIRQRNIMLVTAGAMLAANIMLALGLLTINREIIMVPGIVQEYRISGSKVSSSYLEEMSHMFLSGLLDLTPENIKYKKELVLKYTMAGGIETVNNYFAQAQEQHERFQFSTYYSVKSLEIYPEKMEVKATGILNSRFGRSGYEEKSIMYLLKFEMQGGLLRLKSFTLIDEELEKAKAKKQAKAKSENEKKQ